jgi:diguanylate cyclase (GGDEF)-like protein
VAYLLFGLAGVIQGLAAPVPVENTTQETFSAPARDQNNRFLRWLPYVWVAAAYILLLKNYFQPVALGFIPLALGVGSIIALVIVRQVIVLQENVRLNRQLFGALEKNQQQTVELEKAYHNLEEEIEERKHAEAQLAYDALHDWLTGLPNRVLFLDRLGHAIEQFKRRRPQSFSVLFMDLDHFKVINDSLGHTTGDHLLIEFSRRLTECMRTSDTVARLGGDEFVILIEDVKTENTGEFVANRILEELKKPFWVDGQEIHITASIGIVVQVNAYHSAEEILRDADLAMYRAKSLGKSRFETFYPALRQQAYSRMQIEAELRQAIEKEQLELYYQPIINLFTGKLTGCEALLRWNHPQRGLLLPCEFLQTAEDSGLIIPIGHWVILTACQQIKKWLDEIPGLDEFSVNVNISPRQFGESNFVEDLQAIVKEIGLEAKRIKLEITETMWIETFSTAREKFNRLVQMDFQLEIDDFGSGYSSLGYLQRFPIHTSKSTNLL